METATKRPDAVVYQIDQDLYGFSVAFGEAKLKSTTNLLLVKDLLRIAMLVKDSIDKNNLSSILSFQAVGNRVSFYIMQLKNDGLYMMLESCSVDFPASVADLPRFSLIVNDLLTVAKVAQLCRL
ncbi:hypothetical protein MAM1_0266c08944 [Mucor ambiguus]|uniref:Uncharacterized protein n=1 Tax=Mucor ambiguus TaxID=91626 RepID=A0A0C9N0I1_9FUNG|nr:hypothetical protein MAM1_0266c08944 [Mucor ambiguus]